MNPKYKLFKGPATPLACYLNIFTGISEIVAEMLIPHNSF